MRHPDEGTIHAWLDGQLGVDEARELETHVGACGACAAAVAEARGLVAAASRILTKLDHVPAGVVPAAVVPAAAASRGWWNRPAIQAAAGLVVVVGGSWLVLREQPALAERAQPDIALDVPVVMSAPSATTSSPQLPPAVAKRGGVVGGPAPTNSIAVVPDKAVATAPQNTPPVAAAEVLVGSRMSPMVAGGSANFRSAPEARRAAADLALETARPSRFAPVIAIPGLLVVSTDTLDEASTGPTRRTIYEVRPGLQLTLLAVRDGTAPSGTPRSASQQRDKLSTSVVWYSVEYRANFELSGDILQAELEAIRKKVP